MSTNEDTGLDRATQVAIGCRLEWMYHGARAIHEMAVSLIGQRTEKELQEHLLWSIQEMARAQARDLDALAERLQGTEIGYYAEHFKDAEQL